MATALTPDQQDFYRENGYLHAKGLLSREEALALRAESHALAARRGESNGAWSSVRAADQALQLTHCHDAQFYSAAFTRLLLDPRLTGFAQGLIGPNVELHHTKMFIKPPEKGAPFPLHQDYPYFPHQRDSMTAVIIHFDDAPVEKGCLRVVPGSHKLGPQESFGKDHLLDQAAFPPTAGIDLPARAGDAIFMNYLLVHGSGVNVSQEARTTILIQMRDPTDLPLTGQHRSRGQGMMLAGINPNADNVEFAWEPAKAKETV
jgi:ectoine hydroxylase-related dioxygenase (phytanoyl-CoA dioxygenase family)